MYLARMVSVKLHHFHYILYKIQVYISLLLGNMHLARMVTNFSLHTNIKRPYLNLEPLRAAGFRRSKRDGVESGFRASVGLHK